MTPFRAPIAVFLLALLLTTLGCGEKNESYQHTYTTRGIVIALPGEKAYEEFMVRHEPIPDYVSVNGSIGMESMTMPFPLNDRTLIAGIAVGDKIEMTYGETFEPAFKAGVISIRKLPDDTQLNFSSTPSNP